MTPPHDVMVTNLLGHYRPAPDGPAWYRASQHEAQRIAELSGVTIVVAAGVIAALSPRVQWAVNVRMAEALCRTGVTGGLARSVAAARRIMDGEDPLEVLTGPKTNAFFRAIMGDEDAAVVDVWMMRAVGLNRSKLTSKQYEAVAAALRSAAARAGLPTAEFQAQVWTTIRGRAA